MADDNLTTPVVIQATRIDATLVPQSFTPVYRDYVVNQGTDMGKVAGKANEAGQGAYDAQVKNDEQDIVLDNHEVRITAAEETLVNHEQRITAAEATLVNHEQRITAAEAELADHETRISANEAELADHETRITQNTNDISALGTRMGTAEGDIDTLETNSVSKAVSTSQSVQATGGSFLVGNVATPTTDKLQVGGNVNVSGSYKVAGLPVLGARQTGWTAATGTANKGAFNADPSFTVGATYSQTEVQALADALKAACQRIKALEDMARTHGMIN
ncbi:phage tail protein [Serratia marcescens]|uniref:phage tail protein n=1 Tax=Serratia marcescens TaxID=615 RepID=UPI00217983B1|nr:phage tail protein [Serratia marcescens]CAI0812992.1 Membrane-bound metallopeptidase [Serratia marcescens]CAI1577730.1 Membrane-bound metallopeptidase [Serratia marcescens]